MAEDLRQYYLTTLCKKQLFPWKQGTFVDLDKIYVPVTIDIVIPGVQPIKEQVVDFYQDILGIEQGSPRNVLSGEPGQGKSCFCAKVAFDWCKSFKTSPLKHIALLFVIQLAQIDHTTDIEDAIRSQLKLSVDIDNASLGKVIRDLGKRIVLVLDGLDEAPQNLFDGKNNENFGNIVRTIRHEYLKDCRVIVATRPWRESEITNRIPVYNRLELKKMTKSDAIKYVENYFTLNCNLFMLTLKSLLMKYIRDNKVLVDISNPLILLLICWYWAETKGRKQIPNRIGELYLEIVNMMHRNLGNPTKDRVSILHHIRVDCRGLNFGVIKLH